MVLLLIWRWHAIGHGAIEIAGPAQYRNFYLAALRASDMRLDTALP